MQFSGRQAKRNVPYWSLRDVDPTFTFTPKPSYLIKANIFVAHKLVHSHAIDYFFDPLPYHLDPIALAPPAHAGTQSLGNSACK